MTKMKKDDFMLNSVMIILILIISCSTGQKMSSKIPKADKIPHEINQLGDFRVDNYHWLRDKNWENVYQGKA